MSYEQYLSQQRAKYGEAPDPFGGALTRGYDAFVDAAKGALATPPDTSPSDMTNDRFAQEGRKFLMENDPALLQPEVRNGILYKNGTPSVTFTQGRSTDQQRKMSPFSMTPPSFPDQKIGTNEMMIRMGSATLGAADRGNMAAMSAAGDKYGSIQDYNRAAELAQFQAQQDQYNKGLEAYQKAQEASKNNQRDPSALMSSIVVNDSISRALPLISNWSSGVGSWLSVIPATDARNLKGLIDTMKANAGFDKLQAMREASPTGGALGQVSERELAFLQNVFGNMETDQSPAQLKYNMQLFQYVYNTLIHGVGNHPYQPPAGSEAVLSQLGAVMPSAQGGVDPQTQSDIDTYANM